MGKDRAECGEYTVFVNDAVVYFEHNYYGEDDAICCYHKDGRVYDYDMAFGMCDEIRAWLEANGYNTEDILG